MRNALVIVVVGSSLCIAAPNTQALGFGRTANATQLGQALNFAAMIQLGSDETLARDCVSAEVFSGENKLPASQIRVTLEPGSEPGERSVRVTSTSLIDEPVVTINVSVGCSAKMSRRFVAFIDPPLLNLAQADAASPEKLAPQKFDSAVSPLLAIVQANNGQVPPTTKLSPPAGLAATGASDRPPRAARSAKADRPSTRSAASKAGNSKRTASARQPLHARKGPAGTPPVVVAGVAKNAKTASVSRLQLEPSAAVAERAAASAPSAAAAALTVAQGVASAATSLTPASAPASASATDLQAELLAVERQRIQRLEEGTARLLAESKATRDALAQVQSRLQAAESERYANPLVYVLAVLAALFAGLSVWLWRRQPRSVDAPQWWVAGAQTTSAALAAKQPLTPEEPLALDEPAEPLLETAPVRTQATTESAWEASQSLRLPAGSTREFAAPDPLTMPGGTADNSVDQLIDLEQQAEFFVVLGQDEAATDLLMSHVRSSGGVSPLPYLKLLEIYHRCDDRAAYDRIRIRFNRRFDATAPEWGADLKTGRSLADYPDLLGRLQALWRAPEEVMRALEVALFRRAKTDTTVDLPAYSELLFLFTIARDLSGRELVELDVNVSAPALHAHAGDDAMVDLLLPIDDDPGAAAPAADMTATRTFPPDATPEASVSHSAPLDFDLSMPMGLMTLEERDKAFKAASVEPPAAASNQIEFNDVPSRPSELAYQR